MKEGIKRKSIIRWYFESNLLLRILLALVLGAFTGLTFGESISWMAPFGDIFIRLLKMIVMPVIFSSLVVGAASISPQQLGKIGIKLMLFYLCTSAIAVSIGLSVASFTQPGLGLDLSNIAATGTAPSLEVVKPPFMQIILNIIPTNFFGALGTGKVLPVIFFSILFGIGISYLRTGKDEKLKQMSEYLFGCFNALAEIMYMMVRWVLEYAPIGVFALIAVVFGKQGATALGPLGKLTMVTYLGFIIQIVVVYLGLLALNKFNVFKFLKGSREPLLTGFVTRSSSGALPVTMRTVDKEFGVPQNVYSFTLPLGATINMDGTAIYQGICATFIGIAIGMPLTFGQQTAVVLTAVLASIGTAGIPGAGVIMLLLVLESVGLNVEAGTPIAAAYAMILGIDAILDMGRTMVNVLGDMVATILVAKSEKQIDLTKWEKI